MDSDKKIYLIGNAHIDLVWLWRWQEGFTEVKATFRAALDRMNEFPDFVFTSGCVLYYKWIEENAPEMFCEIKKRVNEGRWSIVGGWWVQPDCNMPSGESLVRHGLYGQRYFLEKFGKIATVGYNVDSFGHCGMLPQILKKSGMDYYVCMRPVDSENNKTTPKGLFWWESMDGSRVLTYKIPDSYTSFNSGGIDKDRIIRNMIEENLKIEGRYGTRKMKKRIEQALKVADEQGVSQMIFYGVGNHGGGPTIASLREIEKLKKIFKKGQLIYSCPASYFEEAKMMQPELIVHKDDLQHSASGCYSTMSAIKAHNRETENRLLAAEKMASVANLLTELNYPNKDIKKAWEGVMFNQFHDILCGCSIEDAYKDAEEFYGEALTLSARVLNSSIQKIAWSIDTVGNEIIKRNKEDFWVSWERQDCGAPLIVFNPLSWGVKIPVLVNREVVGITDENGEPVEIQNNPIPFLNGLGKFNTLFIGEIPPLGYRVYWTYMNKKFHVSNITGLLKAEGNSIENDFIKLEISPDTGYIDKLIDKINNINLISGSGAVPIIIDINHCDTWAHGVFEFRDEIARFADGEIKLLENGPLRIRMRVTNKYKRSILQQDIILYKDKPDIEVEASLDWHERNKLLKLSFPVNLKNIKQTYEIPYGYMERSANGEEEPGLQWIDLSGIINNKLYGIAILNDCKYSHDIKGNDIRMTIANSSYYADHTGNRDKLCKVMDQGKQDFKYTLVPHIGDWRSSGVVKKAYELNTQPVQISETYHKGNLPQIYQGIGISADNVVVTVFKKAEDKEENGFVMRCYETAGKVTDTVIDLPIMGRKWEALFGKCEIKTFFIPENKKKKIYELDLIESKKINK